MSLFPAYAHASKVKEKKDSEDNDETVDKNWLENSSFVEALCMPNESIEKFGIPSKQKNDLIEIQKSKNSDESIFKGSRKNIPKISPDKGLVSLKNEYFSIELKGSREFLNVNTISWPAAPKYRSIYDFKIYHKTDKKKKFDRYFQTLIDTVRNDDQLVKKPKPDTADKKDEYFTGFVQEEEMSQKTAKYNQHLTQYPCDVNMWLEYVKFQDTVYQFEKTYRKGSIAKAQRVLAERKLSILDKALSLNSNSELLHRERLNVAVNTFPADELQMYLKNLVDKNKGNIILWQGYIEATQCSMSHCTAPAVLDLYTRCLSVLHQLRRATAVEKHLMEESILRMLYQCGIFLKQAGLFEQLWTLLKMYLELNLCPTDKSKFDIVSGFDEKQLIGLEELIFTSQLPLHELWLRTEKLRESCHWLPHLSNDNCEDPQRIVFSEDVAELIHPITTPGNNFKLTAMVFSLLKIPLLPCRHTTKQDLGLDYVPWSLDSIEPLLSIFLPLYPIKIIDENFLKDNKLAVGPQYLKTMPGQEEYLKFVLKIMKSCAECLNGDDQLAVTIWWFRFQRLLIILDNVKQLKLSDLMKKQIKKNSKEMLKVPENRQNVLYYLEYGLLEKELGNVEACKNIFDVASQMGENISFETNEWGLLHSTWCFLHRQQVQLIWGDYSTIADKQRMMLILCELVLQRKCNSLFEKQIEEADREFKKIMLKIVEQGVKNSQPSNNFLPDFPTEWIMCYALFLYLNKGIEVYRQFMEKTMEGLDDSNKNPCLQKEILFEFYVALLFKHCSTEPTGSVLKLLDNTVYQAIEVYPNNLFLLSILARNSFVHTSGPSSWKIQNLLLKSGRALCTLFAVIILNQQLTNTSGTIDTVTGEIYGINVGLKNRMLCLFKRITSPNMCTRRCGLVWRLYLQFVYTYYSPDICRNVYYRAVEECPWLKALYIDAAIYIPAELPQIQDLIIEKQLRLHVTPEELEVLRS